MTTTLKEKFEKTIVPELQKELSLKNRFSAPRPQRVVVNIGLGRASQSASFDKILPEITKEFANITGQKPSPRPAKKSIAGFKLREGQVVGLKVTLRGKRMYDFLDKVVKIVFPRLRDFRGISLKNIDEKGNLNLGFRENVVFPEINTDVATVDFGLQVTIVAKAREREQAVAMYRKMGFLFKKEEGKPSKKSKK